MVILKKERSIYQLTTLLNLTGGVLVLLGIAQVFLPIGRIPFEYFQNYLFEKKSIPNGRVMSSGEINTDPDIFYIVLDGYARMDILRDLFNHDNSKFSDDLSSKGFIIPIANQSNYPRTPFSISSTLNMNYIDVLLPELDEIQYSWLVSPLIQDNEVAHILREIGYEIVSVRSGYSVVNNKKVDRYYQPYLIELSEFEYFFIDQTAFSLLEPLLAQITYVRSFEQHRNLIQFDFSALSSISKLPGPQFVYAHIVAPHPPFVFDELGGLPEPDYPFTLLDGTDYPGTKEQYREGYVKQVNFISEQVIQLVSEILENPERPQIIILQADHGGGMLTDFSSSEATCLKERFSPLAAYYLPGVDEDAIPDDITPVNLFRIIFNEYFQADFPLLENRYYFQDARDEISLEQINLSCESWIE